MKSFQEKSAGIMSAALLLSGLLFLTQIISMSSSLGGLAPPTIPIIIVYTIILVVVATLCHIVIAIFAPKEANASIDERERKIFDRAAHLSSYALAAGVVLSILLEARVECLKLAAISKGRRNTLNSANITDLTSNVCRFTFE